eukprot:TRINITY_DN8451_c0_g1_i3.p1 TRINITY_DN8451_c0_g1~~TRINITY_DN8451_c0_g1_i3.p1  ORF type:complete len:123 (+),score=3.36 TRINITY_DN8451_c0_g1_i3:180-548(+)
MLQTSQQTHLHSPRRLPLRVRVESHQGLIVVEENMTCSTQTDDGCTVDDTLHVTYCYTPLQDFVGPEFSKAPTETQHAAWREQEEVGCQRDERQLAYAWAMFVLGFSSSLADFDHCYLRQCS